MKFQIPKRLSPSQGQAILFVLTIGFFVRSFALILTDWHTVQPNEVLGIVNMFVIITCFAIVLRKPSDSI